MSGSNFILGIKSSLALIVFIFCNTVNAELDDQQQLKIVNDIARADRRELWQMGHEEVKSTIKKLSAEEVSDLIDRNIENHEPLDGYYISVINSCVRKPTECQVYTIENSSNYYSGYGVARRWVMLNPESGKHESIVHTVYEE